MATMSSVLPRTRSRVRPALHRTVRPGAGPQLILRPWLRAQSINVTRHAAALRPFRREEFGTGAAAPSESHIQAVNSLIKGLRRGLIKLSKTVTKAIDQAGEQLSPPALERAVTEKDRAHKWVQGIEKIWDFYFELFGQRQSMPYAEWLLSCDRIALNCYQIAFTGIGTAKSIPAPPPFCFMRTGFAPATMRRGIRLRRLGRQFNPFPLVQLPYHRLVNPWTLGAVLHEVSHNLQNDLGLERAVPVAIGRRLREAGHQPGVVRTWVRWNRETFADLSGLLLGGPAVVASLMDVIGRSPAATYNFTLGGL